MKTLKQFLMEFKDKLKIKMDEYVHLVYDITKGFPSDELYGITSQIRRSSMSIVLNYIEGYARKKPKVQLNFMETSYASLQESKYILQFSHKRGFINDDIFGKGFLLVDEIGAMLWTEIKSLSTSLA